MSTSRADIARARARERPDMGVYITLTSETGDGPAVAVKDVVDVRGTVTTAGGIVLPQVPAAADAPVISRLRKAGCVVVGKANMHEFALGPTSENPHYGPVRNPRDPARVAGGSSGGSAAAVALGMCDWAIGSDTGGSIRIPAALCGVVGIKPTLGSVPVAGTIPVSKTLDTLGPLAPDVRTAAGALEIMTGRQGLVPSPDNLAGVPPPRLAVPTGWGDDLAPDAAGPWRDAAGGLPRISFPPLAELRSAGATILRFEAAAVHREWLARDPEKYGADVRELLLAAQDVSQEQYTAALELAARLRAAVEEALGSWDAIVAPATRIVAPVLGGRYDRADFTDYTRPFSTTGHPVITLPLPGNGLPSGAQVVGGLGREADLIQVAAVLEAQWR
jgi:Asp-tRNA(Asn)/Glu-tRNA(Gln) amidotransferase A subunit family amidase